MRVGDVVRLTNGQAFPADLILLASSEPHGMAYIETSSLDGETNLKIRQALPATCHLINIGVMNNFSAEVECEPPNKHVNEFTGKLSTQELVRPLSPSQLLLRGARLKNTKWIHGVVVYTGHDAKLLMNSKTAPLKRLVASLDLHGCCRSNIDTLTNRRIIVFFVALILLALISAGGAEYYKRSSLAQAFYLPKMNSNDFPMNFLTFFILYNNLIPISLQVTLEVVRFFQAIYINNVSSILCSLHFRRMLKCTTRRQTRRPPLVRRT